MISFAKCIALMLLLGTVCLAQEAKSTRVDLQLSQFRVAETSSDHIRVGVHASVRSRERAKVTRLTIDQAYLNGVPVFLSPVEDSFEVPANEFVELPGELTASIYYRDVDGPEPLERLLENRSVTLKGEATITVQLNLAEKIALLANTATSKTPISVEMPVSLPGGELGRSAALLALRAARPLFGAAKQASAAGGVWPQPDPWREEVKNKYRDAILYVVTRYSLRDKHGAITPYTCTGTGFRIGPARFVLLREALEPWSFNPEAMARMKADGAKVMTGDVDIFVYTAGEVVDSGRTGFSLRRGDFRVVDEGKEDRKRIFVKSDKGLKKGELDVRADRGNIAVLEFSSPPAMQAVPDLARETEAQPPLAILRFVPPQEGKPLEVEAIDAQAKLDGQALALKDPVDKRSFGSPVVASSGIVAFVQDERAASLLRSALKRAGYSLAD